MVPNQVVVTTSDDISVRPSMKLDRIGSELREPLLTEFQDDVEADKVATPSDDGGRVWTKQTAPLILGFMFTMFVQGALVSIVGPFMPQELKALGASSTVIGVTFAAEPLTTFLAGPLVMHFYTRYGGLPTLLCGVAIDGTLSIAQGFFTSFSTDNQVRICIFGVLRLLQEFSAEWRRQSLEASEGLGFGAAASYNSIYAMIAEVFPGNMGAIIGLQEVGQGLGFMLGPPIGSVLYAWLGFSAPFVVMGVSHLSMLLLLPVAFRLSGSQLQIATPAQKEAQDLSHWQAAFSAEGTVSCIVATVMTATSSGFIVPSLQQHLVDTLEVNVLGVGVLFALPALFYMLCAPVAGALGDSNGHETVIAAGVAIMCSGFLLLGPFPPVAEFMPIGGGGLWVCEVLGLILLGTAFAFICVPAMPC
eukprot:gene20788-24918_t